MATPFPTTELPPNTAAWHELEDAFAALGRLVRSPATPAEFYRELLDQSVRALSAVGGAVWLRGDRGGFQLIAQNGWPLAAAAAHMRQAHEALLASVAEQAEMDSVAAHSIGHAGDDGGPSGCVLIAAPVQRLRDNANGQVANASNVEPPPATVAIIEILERPDAGPGAHRGHEQFLRAVCELAADYHAFRELGQLRENETYREALLRLGRSVHRDLGLAETAYAVANDGRSVVGCDRLSVLLSTSGGRCRLLATSGAQRVERRSSAARHLETLAHAAARTGDAAYYDDGESDSLPQIAEALEQHAESSQARQIAAIPLRPLADIALDDEPHTKIQKSWGVQTFVLIAEQFAVHPGDLERQRLMEVADMCATALINALEVDQIPFGGLVRPLGVVRQRFVRALAAVCGGGRCVCGRGRGACDHAGGFQYRSDGNLAAGRAEGGLRAAQWPGRRSARQAWR